MKKFRLDKFSPEQLAELGAAYEAETHKREVRESLPKRKEVKTVHASIKEASEALDVDEDEIRIAEMATYSSDFPGLVAKVNKHLEDWKRGNATYQDPENPNYFWYSPDGKGNPPKWIVDIAGKKPDGKDETAMHKWLKKLEPYKVKKGQIRKAA